MNQEKSLSINNHFQLQYEECQKCFVLLYPEGMVQLSFSAGEIMNLCDGKNSANDIIEQLTIKFNGADLKKDVIDFLEEAIQRNWVIYA